MIPWKEIELDRPETSAPCLVCGQEAGALFHLSRTLLRHAFSNRGQIPPPPEALQEDYTMFRCGQCGLEFADPMAVPAAFYPWITAREDYHPQHREEWSLLFQIAGDFATKGSTLEIGCGSGAFLDAARAAGWGRVAGVDLAETSVETCRSKGHEAVAGDLKDLEMLCPRDQTRFDLVVGFHVLEHVPDPVGLTLDSLRVLAPGGRVFFSLPLSPNDHEHLIFDPKLYPPHHLTRWTGAALEALGRRCGARVRLHPLRRRSWARRLSHSLFCFQKARGKSVSLASRMACAVTHPAMCLSELRWQLGREFRKEVHSDHALVELQPLRG